MWKYAKVRLHQQFATVCQNTFKQIPFKQSSNVKVKLFDRFLKHYKKSDAKLCVAPELLSAHPKGNITISKSTDTTLCQHAPTMNSAELLQHLTLCVKKSYSAVNLEFYQLSRALLSLRIEQLSPQELVQFMFLLALQKKKGDSRSYMQRCLSFLHSDVIKKLDLTDLLIVCKSTFKTSTRINNKELLHTLKELLYNNLALLDDPPLFTTLVKAFRFNACQDEELLNTISAAIFFNHTYKHYRFLTICHILPLYVDYLYYDEKLFTLFAELGMAQLQTSKLFYGRHHSEENIRAKDIKRFLWCYSYIGHKFNYSELQMIESKILERIENEYYDNDADSLIDSTFYLWMMEYQSPKLVELCKERARIVRGKLSKSNIRLDMLLVCMQLENSQLYRSFGYKADSFKLDKNWQVAHRPALKIVHDALKTLMPDMEINRLEYEYQIPHINIVGITGYRKNIYKAFAVELLDETTRLRNNPSQPIGPMLLKMRLLYKMDITVILIDTEGIENMNAAEIQEFIKNEMALISK